MMDHKIYKKYKNRSFGDVETRLMRDKHMCELHVVRCENGIYLPVEAIDRIRRFMLEGEHYTAWAVDPSAEGIPIMIYKDTTSYRLNYRDNDIRLGSEVLEDIITDFDEELKSRILAEEGV